MEISGFTFRIKVNDGSYRPKSDQDTG